MALSPIQPDQNSQHTFVVKAMIDKDKTFKSAEGVKQKYVIEFTNGYAAEYCPLMEAGPDDNIITGMPLTFRIIYRKPFGDEILPYYPEKLKIEQMLMGEKSLMNTNKVVNISGHPAISALSAAKDLNVARINCGAEVDVADVLENADKIYKWLIDKVTNS